ncbi:MAG TPA: ABC transporter substrate-binding protein [Cellulomonas sp.]
MHRQRRHVLAIAALVAATTALTACSSSSSDSSTSGADGDQNVVFAMTSRGVSDLDPLSDTLVTNNAYTLDKIMEPLVELQEDGTIGPLLAESWEVSDDGLTWTFHLQDDVTFSDGSTFDSADVLYSFQRHQEVGGSLPISAPVDSFEAPDASTFVVNLTSPYAALLADFATFAYVIVPEDLNGLDADEFFEDPVGTGPFTVGEWDVVSGEITLDANKDYWQGAPSVDSVEFVVVDDSNQLVQQLLSGEVDLADNVPASALSEIEDSGSASVVQTPSWLEYILAFNTVDGVFADSTVRRAVAQAIDRTALTEATTNGTGTPATSFLPASILYSDQDIDIAGYDVDAAQADLDSTSQAGGFATSLIVESGDATLAAQATAIQGYLAEIGIEVSIESLDSTAFWNRFGARDYDLAVVISTSDTGDPSNLAGWQLDPDLIDSYHTGFDNAEVQSLMDQGLATSDDTQRAEIYSQLQQLVADELPSVPLTYKSSLIGVRDGIDGLVVLPNGTTRLAGLTVSE